MEGIKFENELVAFEIGSDGTCRGFIDKRSGRNYATVKLPVARIHKNGKEHPVKSADIRGNRVIFLFKDTKASAEISITACSCYFVIDVLSFAGEDVDKFTFVDIVLPALEESQDSFAACVLALNLKTNVVELPGAGARLSAVSYPKFSFVGAKAALIAGPRANLRQYLQQAILEASDLPHSPLGGPWAMDGKANRGSYFFDRGISESNVDDWINVAKAVGFNQINIYAGYQAFRHGDFEPNPKLFPNGRCGLKNVIDRLHLAGIMAGFHTLSCFIDGKSSWVSPIPDPRLAKDAVFTLAKPLSISDDIISVCESTEQMSTARGERNEKGVVLQLENELVSFSGISKYPPYAFTGCRRGLHGTWAANHAVGTKAAHLKQCWGIFVPDGDTSLIADIAAKAADLINECGFDMMYLDGLDGEDLLGDPKYGWHYGAKYVFEIWRRLKRPLLVEMATFHHHLWYLRSRLGAWDYPRRDYKRFIDLHLAANDECRRIFMPAHLGWWGLLPGWGGIQQDRMFMEDVEYLCGKVLGTDTGFSLLHLTPDIKTVKTILPRMVEVINRYEKLRNAGYFSEEIKAWLKVPGNEFKLVETENNAWRFRQMFFPKNKMDMADNKTWHVQNANADQPMRLRIEALLSAVPYDAPENIILTDFSDLAEFTQKSTAEGVDADIESDEGRQEAGPGCRYSARVAGKRGCLSAQQDVFSALIHGTRLSHKAVCLWSRIGKCFSPALDLRGNEQGGEGNLGLGLWVYGDGQGEVLNIQLKSPAHVSAVGDRYVIIDFKGWKYFELIEMEGARVDHYDWPYSGNLYGIYRTDLDFAGIESLNLWYNNIPLDKTVSCRISPIKALRLLKTKIINPTIRVGSQKLVFPVELETGQYLETGWDGICRWFDQEDHLIGEIKPIGNLPILAEGDNELTLDCHANPANINPRIRVTVMIDGELV